MKIIRRTVLFTRNPGIRCVPRRLTVVGLFILCVASTARGQGSKADYERADGLQAATRDKVLKTSIRPHWLPGGERFWYRNDLPEMAREFILVDAAKAERRPAFDHAKLAEALGKAVGKPQRAERLPIERIDVADRAIHFEAEGKAWRFDPATGELKDAPLPVVEEPKEAASRRGRREAPQESPRADDSPDGKFAVVVRDRNVVLREKATGKSTPLSFDGSEVDAYQPRVFWSPDSKWFVALRTARGDRRIVQMIESSPRGQLQPKLHEQDYLKPGDKVAVTRPRLFDVEGCKEIPIKDDLAPNPWSIDEFRWAPDSSRFTFLYNQRGHQVLRIVSVDAKTGEAKPIVDEQSKTFIDYSSKTYALHLDKTHELIWMSERDGWNHLHLIDANSGKVKNQLTRGPWLVLGVERVDEELRQVWFRAGGIHADQDPYHVHYARVNFDGSGLVVLTAGDGTHQIDYSPDRKYLVDTYSRVDLPPVIEVRKVEDGSLVCELERADASALKATGWKPPERFVAKGRDGATDVYGVIFRPSTYREDQKYPVIESIYAGPQGAFVPKRFASFHPHQALAELRFIVVQIDGMGTNWRSKAFHDVCWKNLADAGFPDRILWMKAAAEKDKAMDLSRVGIYGGSAGGQNALGGLLTHPEFYKAGAADCGCHDNRMDKIWWNEQWMGWPIGPHYAEQSNVTMASKLQGKLLLTVGELDRNVDPASTMQVVDALIKADKDFDLIVFPGADHGAGGGTYGDRRRRDFFVRHLLGVEPRGR
ncbi:MAG: prolyl oligopeptidase family serine peptidase [Paludisphaera borealis]|uniref:S9 family peptidase n=1 Tax=Paludisphaera borealis TaxID=1387353 RepID=UPI00284C63A1|nr:prolyl oligopeptidase family serine peptidase [Paludisphaera borealis]MDR3617902.1 prolyl oligopeptidase family serine peptidase [Paludisphaera borealis]